MLNKLADKIKTLFCKWSRACSVEYVCELDSHNCHKCTFPFCRHFHSYCHNHFIWYRQWHHHPSRPYVHWAIFISYLVVATFLVYSNIAKNVGPVEAETFAITANASDLVVLDV